MKAILLVTGSGPLLIVTSYASATDPKLVEGLRQKGIEKFIAFELPLAMVRQRYGGHFSVVGQGSSEGIRILDLDGRRAFHLSPRIRSSAGNQRRGLSCRETESIRVGLFSEVELDDPCGHIYPVKPITLGIEAAPLTCSVDEPFIIKSVVVEITTGLASNTFYKEIR